MAKNKTATESIDLKSPLVPKSRLRRGMSNMQGREDVYKFVRESASMYNAMAASVDNTPENLKKVKSLQSSVSIAQSRESISPGLGLSDIQNIGKDIETQD